MDNKTSMTHDILSVSLFYDNKTILSLLRCLVLYSLLYCCGYQILTSLSRERQRANLTKSYEIFNHKISKYDEKTQFIF